MKKIAVVTGTRAEYGLLKPLIRAIFNDSDLELQLVATGMHLSPEFGLTYKQIEKDGFRIDKRVEDDLSGDTAEDISKAIGTALIGFAEAYKNLMPDIVLVLGDRSEILAAATAAMIKGIPLAHIHGGETTEGAYDEAIRHAITKMSYLHFTSAEPYRKRVIQLGESPDRVFNVGAIGIDSIKTVPLLDREELEESIEFKFQTKNLLITYHPVTLEKATAQGQFNALLRSLDKLENTALIFTKPNSDKDGRIIIDMIDEYVSANLNKAVSFKSLGQLLYLSTLQFVDAVVGNSSSGIFEAPIFRKPTINIGDRQKGRLIPASVINCSPDEESIDRALSKALNSKFINSIKNQTSIYGNGTATPKILSVLKTFKIEGTKKAFYDL